MRTKDALFALAAVMFVAASAIVFVRLRHERVRLERRVFDLRGRVGEAERQAAERHRVRQLMASAANGPAVNAELEQARSEVAELERADAERAARRAARHATHAPIAEPERGLVRLENFRDVGQGTPSDVIQTMIFAALKGDNERLAQLFTFEPAARKYAEDYVAQLSGTTREKFPTPASVACLLLSEAVTGHAAARLVGPAVIEGPHATVTLSFSEADSGHTFHLESEPSGWRIVIEAAQLRAALDRIGR
jgi:hypothetical protein